MSSKDFSSLYQDKIKSYFNDTLKNLAIESSLKNTTNSIKKSISSFLSPQLTEKLLNTSSSTLNDFLMELLYEDQSGLQRNLVKFENTDRKKLDASLTPKIINKITNFSSKINSQKTSGDNELKNNISLNKQKIDSSFDKINHFHERRLQSEKNEEKIDNSVKRSDKNTSNDFIKEETKDSENNFLKINHETKEIINENPKKIDIEINPKEIEQKEQTCSDQKKLLKEIVIKQEEEIPKEKDNKKNNSVPKEINMNSSNKSPSPNVVSLRSKLKNSIVKTSHNKDKQQSKSGFKKSLFTDLKNKKTKVKNKEIKSYNTRYKSNEDHNNFKESNSSSFKETTMSSVKQNLSELSSPKSRNTEDKQLSKTNCKKSLFNNIKNKKIKAKSKKIKSFKSCNNEDLVPNTNDKEATLKSLSGSAKQNSSLNSTTERKSDNQNLSESTPSEDNLSNFRNKPYFSNKSSLSLNSLSIKNLKDLSKFLSHCNVSMQSQKDLFCDHCIAGRYYIRKGLSNPIPLKSQSNSKEKTPYHKQTKKVIKREKNKNENNDDKLDQEEESCFSDDSTSSIISEDLCKSHLSYLNQIYEEMDSHILKSKNPDRNEKQSPITSKQSDIESKENQYFEQTKNLQKSPSSTKPSQFDSVAKVNLENEQMIKETIRREQGKERNIRKSDGAYNENDPKVLLSNLLSTDNEATALLHQVFLKNRVLSLSDSNPLLKTIFQRSGFSSDLVRLASSKSNESLTGKILFIKTLFKIIKKLS